MGTVIAFPAERPAREGSPEFRGHASIVILPVIRIERHAEEPSGAIDPNPRSTPGRRRRKR
jgi:hypothetical protein